MKKYAYAVSSKNKSVLLKSSSSGAFYHLAEYYINVLKGVVYGTALVDACSKIIRITKFEDIKTIQKNENIRNIAFQSFVDCKRDLRNNLYVLFSGTPCQIAALLFFLKRENINNEKLLTLDIVCHGSLQPKYWNMYLKELNNKYYPNQEIGFRYKKKDWETPYIKIGRTREKATSNPYMTSFLRNYILEESCYSCHFKNKGYADVTIGDFLGVESYYPEYYNKKGVSIVILREEKKEQILNIFLNETYINEVSFSLSLFNDKHFFLSATKPSDIDLFVDECSNNGIINASKKRFSNKANTLLELKNAFNKFFKLIPAWPNKFITSNSVGIITDVGFSNFGNKLQNFALRTILIKNGFENVFNLHTCKHTMFHKIYHLFRYIFYMPPYSKREKRIRKASIKSGEKNFFFDYSSKDKKAIQNFKAIVFGSDQIWNWSHHLYDLPFNLGLFGFKNTTSKTTYISYAASIGVSYIPQYLNCYFQEGLSIFKAISVREKKAQSSLLNLGIKSEITLDPVLLLSKNEWDFYISKYSQLKHFPNNYSIVYLLSNKLNYEVMRNISLNDEIVNILDRKGNFFAINHFDFVALISNSNLVITDSFHATVFAIIYSKKIYLVKREGMEERLKSLFEEIKVKLEYNKVIDFSKFKIDINKKNSLTFLLKNLKLHNND